MADQETRKAWAEWMKSTMQKYNQEDCLALTVSLGKGVSLSRLRNKLEGSKDACETLSSKIEHLIRRLITWIENNHHLSTFSFYVLPTGPMGNRHVHVVLMGNGLGNVSIPMWENRLNHALQWYCPDSTARLSNADGRWADYITSMQNLPVNRKGEFLGEVKTRGCIPK
jgi:hypothetical protein